MEVVSAGKLGNTAARRAAHASEAWRSLCARALAFAAAQATATDKASSQTINLSSNLLHARFLCVLAASSGGSWGSQRCRQLCHVTNPSLAYSRAKGTRWTASASAR